MFAWFSWYSAHNMLLLNYPAVPAAGSFNQLINSGIVHPTGVLIVPLLAGVTGNNSGFGDSQWKSPFNTCLCTTSPVSLTNLQVSVAGQNVLQSTIQFGDEHFFRTSKSCGTIGFFRFRNSYRIN